MASNTTQPQPANHPAPKRTVALFSRSLRQQSPLWNTTARILSQSAGWVVRDIEVTPTTPGDVTIPSTSFSIICQQSSTTTTQHTPPNNASSSDDDFAVLNQRIEQLLSRSRTPVILVLSLNINDFLNIQLRLVKTFSDQISVLPAFTPDDAVSAIKALVTGYRSGLEKITPAPASNPLDLLSQMTTHPPLAESVTYMLHDTFPSIADLANARVKDLEVLEKRDAEGVVKFWEGDWVVG